MPTLDQMAEEAVTEVEGLDEGNSAEQTPTPAEPEVTPSAEVEAAPAGEAKPTAEQAQPEVTQESFTHIDPKTLSPENQQVYKSLQADYTRKRQAETARIRELETQLASQGQQAAQPQVPNQAGNQDFLGQLGLSEEQLAHMTLPEYTAYVLESAKRGVQIETEQKSVESFEQQAVVDFLSLDARLNPEVTDSFDPPMAAWIGSELDKRYLKHIQETGSPLGFDYRTAATELISQHDTREEKKLKDRIAKTTETARNNAKTHLKSAPPGTSSARVTKSTANSLDESIEAAFDEQ